MLDDGEHGFGYSYKSGLGNHPPSLASLCIGGLAADLAELLKPDHVVESAIALDVQYCANTVVTRHNFRNRNFAVLAVLALVDLGLILAVQITEIYASVN